MSRRSFDKMFDPEAAMIRALEELRALGLPATKCSPYQLKVGPFNFYPSKQTIFKDGDKKALDQRGLPELIRLLEQLRRSRRRRDDDPPESVTDIRPVDLNV